MDTHAQVVCERADVTTTDDATDEAIARADQAANEEWKQMARRVIESIIQRGGEFTSDLVQQVLAELPVHTHETRALGGIMREFARAGRIRSTGRFEKSTRAACHQNPKRVWEVVD